MSTPPSPCPIPHPPFPQPSLDQLFLAAQRPRAATVDICKWVPPASPVRRPSAAPSKSPPRLVLPPVPRLPSIDVEVEPSTTPLFIRSRTSAMTPVEHPLSSSAPARAPPQLVGVHVTSPGPTATTDGGRSHANDVSRMRMFCEDLDLGEPVDLHQPAAGQALNRFHLDSLDLDELHLGPPQGLVPRKKDMFVDTEIGDGEMVFSVSPTLQSCLDSMRRGGGKGAPLGVDEEVEMEFL